MIGITAYELPTQSAAVISLNDNARNVNTFHESKLLRNRTFSHVLRDQSFRVLWLIALRMVNINFFSILKILCEKEIEKSKLFLNFCNGRFVKGCQDLLHLATMDTSKYSTG